MAYIEEANELMTDATGQSIATAIGNMSATSVGNLAALQTTDKTSLVGAVNEVKSGLIGAYYKLDNSVKGETITTLWGTVTKISNVVTIQGLWVGSATNTDVITLLPEEYRPVGPAAAMGSGILDNAGTLICAEYSILPTGELRQAQQVGAASGGTFTFTYAV